MIYRMVAKTIRQTTRIWVSSILGFLASGDSIEIILQVYPLLTRKDVLVCIDDHGAGMSDDRYREIPSSAA